MGADQDTLFCEKAASRLQLSFTVRDVVLAPETALMKMNRVSSSRPIASLGVPSTKTPPARSTTPLKAATGWSPAKQASTVAVNAANTSKSAAVQRPPVTRGGLQHNANNPEVVDTTGRSYSSRSFGPAGVPFADRTGNSVSQDIFSSNKNMTGEAVSQSLVLTNPGEEAMKVNVKVAVSDPPQARGTKTQAIVIPTKSAVRVPVGANVTDKGFTAFKASVTPVDDAAKKGKLHVDVAVHAPTETDATAPS